MGDRPGRARPVPWYHLEKLSPGSVVGAPARRKLKWSESCQTTFPASAPFWPPWSARVRVPSAKVDVPAIVIGGLPGPVVAQVKRPSSWIARVMLASLAGVAAHLPDSFPSAAGEAAGTAPERAGGVPPGGW